MEITAPHDKIPRSLLRGSSFGLSRKLHLITIAVRVLTVMLIATCNLVIEFVIIV